jgi:hypothetical protein
VGEGGVLGGTTPEYAQIGDIVEKKIGLRGCGDGEEVGAVDVFEVEGGAWVGVGGGYFDVGHFEVF